MHPLWGPSDTSEGKIPEEWLWPLAVIAFVVNAVVVAGFFYLS